MTTKQLAALFATLLIFLSGTYLLPRVANVQPCGLKGSRAELPKSVGAWTGEDLEVSPLERQVLGPETEFARKLYRDGTGMQIMTSIVLAGSDMNNSIHRPERCLPQQGWSILGSRKMPVNDGADAGFQATRMLLQRQQRMEGSNETFALNAVNYYWFVGSNDVTGDHGERTAIDVRDRLFGGYNQRWAFVTVLGVIPPVKNEEDRPRAEAYVDERLRDFIRLLVPEIHGERLRYKAP